MTGLSLLIAFVAAIALMIVAISKFNIHPFLAMIGVAILLAIAAGIPLNSIPGTIGKGFSSIFASIGLVIIFGMLIGLILEKTGAAIRIADSIVKLIGPRHPQIAMILIGWIVSIPVFCDSGFVIVNPIRKGLARKTGTSSVALTMALSAGLFASHVLIPPTPGPIAAAGMVGLENNLLLVIGLGVVVSLASLVAAFFFIKFISKRVQSTEDCQVQEESKEYENMLNSFGKLPSLGASLTPILVPVLLMAVGSVLSVVPVPAGFRSFMQFLGTPVIALIVGFLCGVALLAKSETVRISSLQDICQETLKTAGPIIFITAAGGVLGNVIVETGFIEYIKANATVLSTIGVFFPFIIAAILKSAMGSSTVAITTTASMMGLFTSANSMMAVLGMTTPFDAALVVMAIGAGAMTVSHANDSYFWVVTGFGGISPKDGYRTQTLMTLVMGLAAIIAVFILSLIF